MNIKHKELVIPPDKPFQNCKLGRSKNAEVLTAIVNTYADGFVLAINNKWGTGKTTFIKMWQQQLENRGYKTLYFNAWENDFESSPLVALMGELKSIIPRNKTTKTFDKLTQKAGIIAKNILPTLAAGIAAKYIGSDTIKDLIKATTEAGAEIFSDEIEKYSTKKMGLVEFRETLSKFIAELKSEKPIIFIIDELDRCRPNYAVEVLENIKHFFNVPNIVFVLSIDKEQLSHAIRGVYGSENLDADEYLRRFIDLEYQIPDPETDGFSEYLYEYFDFNRFFKSALRLNNSEFRNDESTFLFIAANLFKKETLTLRQQEQIFAYARIVLSTFAPKARVHPEIIILLIFFKLTNVRLFSKIKCKILSIEELNTELNQVLPNFDTTFDNTHTYFLYAQAKIISLYSTSLKADSRGLITSIDKTSGEEIFTLRSKYDPDPEGLNYKKNFSELSRHWNNIGGMDSILTKISLIDNIVA